MRAGLCSGIGGECFLCSKKDCRADDASNEAGEQAFGQTTLVNDAISHNSNRCQLEPVASYLAVIPWNRADLGRDCVSIWEGSAARRDFVTTVLLANGELRLTMAA